MLVLGLLVPAHLRAVDSSVLQQAGIGSPGLIDSGIVLVGEDKLGTAQLFLQAAERIQLPGRQKLDFAVNDLAGRHPAWVVWGGPEPRFDSIFEKESGLRSPGSRQPEKLRW